MKSPRREVWIPDFVWRESRLFLRYEHLNKDGHTLRPRLPVPHRQPHTFGCVLYHHWNSQVLCSRWNVTTDGYIPSLSVNLCVGVGPIYSPYINDVLRHIFFDPIYCVRPSFLSSRTSNFDRRSHSSLISSPPHYGSRLAFLEPENFNSSLVNSRRRW